jgi:hypothetical protein
MGCQYSGWQWRYINQVIDEYQLQLHRYHPGYGYSGGEEWCGACHDSRLVGCELYAVCLADHQVESCFGNRIYRCFGFDHVR